MYLLSPNMYFLIILKLQNLIVENDYKFRKNLPGNWIVHILFSPFFYFPLSHHLFVHSFMHLFILYKSKKHFHITKRPGVKLSINK